MLSRAGVRWQSEALLGSAVGRLTGRLALSVLLVFFSSRVSCAFSQDEEADEENDGASRAPVKVEEISFPENIGRNLMEHGGCWLPVYVEFKATSREAQSVLLQGTVQSDGTASFSRREKVEVAPGAPVRAWIYLRTAAGRSQTATLDVRTASGATLARRRWTVSSFWPQASAFSMLVVGEQLGDILPWPGDLSGSRNNTGEDRHFSADSSPAKALPDRVLGYHGMDLVILRDLGEGKLEPAQVEALRAWVYLGGFVVLVPGSHSSEIFRSAIARELCGDALEEPRPLDGFVPEKLLFFDSEERNAARRDQDTVKISLGRGDSFTLLDPLRPEKRGVREIVSSSDKEDRQEAKDNGEENDVLASGARLYSELRYGQGRVGVLSLNDQTHREAGASFLRDLWRRIVEWRIRTPKGSFSERAATFLSPDLERLLNDASRDVGLVFLVALIGAYLLLVGPGLYFLLRRWNRLPAVIWAEPLLVLLYLGVIFGTAYITKGVLTKTRIWTFISQREGEALAVRESYLTVFSADDALYRISSPRGMILQPIFKNEKEEQPVALSRASQGGLMLEDFKLGHWQQGHLVNVEVLDFEGTGVSLNDSSPGGDLARPFSVAISNHLPYPIREGIVLGKSSRAMVPRIEPGKTVVVRLETAIQRPVKEPKGEETSWQRFFQTGEDFPFQKKGFTVDGRWVFAGLLERTEEDFHLDKRSSLKERLDVYLLYR
jgi:hypothetical protein